MCRVKISWTSVAVDPLVLDRHLAGDEHADDRLAAAAAGAAGLVQDDVAAAGGGHVLAELVQHLAGAGGLLAGGRADLDANMLVVGPLVERRFSPSRQCVVPLEDVVGHDGPRLQRVSIRFIKSDRVGPRVSLVRPTPQPQVSCLMGQEHCRGVSLRNVPWDSLRGAVYGAIAARPLTELSAGAHLLFTLRSEGPLGQFG